MSEPEQDDLTEYDHLVAQTGNGAAPQDPGEQPPQDPGWLPPGTLTAGTPQDPAQER